MRTPLLAAQAKTWLNGLVFALTLCINLPSFAAPVFPALSGRVVDDAQVLSAPAEAALTAKLAGLEAKTQHQLAVVTLKDLQGYDIADYGYQLGRTWALGRKDVNDGVVFIIAPSDRKVRIEVGYGLEPVLTDALSNVILQTRVLPKFKAGDIEGGVTDGTDAIITQLTLEPAEAQKNVQAAAKTPESQDLPFPVWIFIILFIWIFIAGRRGRRRGGIASALPWIIFSGGGGGRGGFGGGSGGGGGFSGGGGSFGGGGSSGSW